MAKVYTLQFGTGNPTGFSGLAPSMLIFYNLATGATNAPPIIAETPVGWGMYTFSYGTTQPIWFLADACTTSPGAAGRYIAGIIDPADRADEYGNTLVAIGNTLTFNVPANMGATLTAIGNTAIAYGGTISAVLVNTGSTLSALGLSNIALGTTNIAIGTTITSMLSGVSSALLLSIGSTASLIGDSVTSPVDLFGYLKRVRALYEGNQTFTKGVGTLTQYDTTGATTLYSKTIMNNASLVTKT